MMITKNRIVRNTVLLSLFALLASCEQTVTGDEPTKPSIAEPVLISYFAPFEQLLFYAEEHWDAVVTDGHLLEAGATGSRYSGLTIGGEPQIYEVMLVPVPQKELEAISIEQDEVYKQILSDMDSADIAFAPARGRRHMGLKCGAAFKPDHTCEEVNDSTSIRRIYNEFKRCEDGTSTDRCTEFSVVWYTEMTYNARDCERGGGGIIAVNEEEAWRCY